jgi:EAL domain-containing protein (putative c-di-GMP-specific phosphodiesterase class I)
MNDKCLLDTVLKPNALQTRFQPIFQVGATAQRLHAVEGLNRGPAGTNLESAGVLFEYARRKRKEPVVDLACVQAVLEAARGLPPDVDISLNVHGSSLGRDPRFVQVLMESADKKGIALTRLIVEVVEQVPVWDRPGLRSALETLRQHQVRIALDDLGSGNSNFRMLLDCRPDYVKVDSSVTLGCAADYYQRAVLESSLNLSRRLGAIAVAEGVERFADLETVISMGFTLVQCYLLAPPMTVAELQACDWFPRRSSRFQSPFLPGGGISAVKLATRLVHRQPALLQISPLRGASLASGGSSKHS